MPPEVAQRAERIGQYVLWLRHGLVLAFVLGTVALQSLAFSQIGLPLDGWQSAEVWPRIACTAKLAA